MLMQETGSETVGIIMILSLLAVVVMILWIFLPFAIFGVKGILGNILAEQKRTTSAVNALKKDVREIAREALQPGHHKQIPPN